MEIRYPILIKDTDGYIDIITAERTLNWLEYNDVYDHEYLAWDSEGFSVELFLEGKEIKGRYASDNPKPEEVIKAIKDFMKKPENKRPFEYFGAEDNLMDMFKAVKKYLNI